MFSHKNVINVYYGDVADVMRIAVTAMSVTCVTDSLCRSAMMRLQRNVAADMLQRYAIQHQQQQRQRRDADGQMMDTADDTVQRYPLGV